MHIIADDKRHARAWGRGVAAVRAQWAGRQDRAERARRRAPGPRRFGQGRGRWIAASASARSGLPNTPARGQGTPLRPASDRGASRCAPLYAPRTRCAGGLRAPPNSAGKGPRQPCRALQAWRPPSLRGPRGLRAHFSACRAQVFGRLRLTLSGFIVSFCGCGCDEVTRCDELIASARRAYGPSAALFILAPGRGRKPRSGRRGGTKARELVKCGEERKRRQTCDPAKLFYESVYVHTL